MMRLGLFSMVIAFGVSHIATAQVKGVEKAVPMHFVSTIIPATPSGSVGKFIFAKADQQRYYRLSVPVFTQRGLTGSQIPSTSYWTGYVTTQSFRNGKVGTFYYWDIQGNLRESRLFFDVKRKNKYSFKLVFPRR
jgi:hypothetical protein